MQQYKYIAGLEYFSFPIIEILYIPEFYLGKYPLPEIISKFNVNSAGFSGRNPIRRYETCSKLAVMVSLILCLSTVY